ncbi:MAG: ral secretion pathway protein [Sphingomonadales bacterium]|jgi:putative secretion ATPase (PEP-CTERM system associated)|nr:ral secretion pathway protein [Sphingomonadales bacterium]
MYTDHYGLAERPFQLTPDARYWYESRTHKKAMAYLGYGLAQGEGFIVITGEIGAGKSTLVAHLMATIDRERLNAISLVSTQVEGDDMLRLAAQGLGLETGGVMKAQLLDRIEQRLREEASSGKRTLLIVDEAQNLPVSALEELRMLSNFTSQGRALIQIFLLGQPEFRDRVAADDSLEQLRQRVIASHHLEAMEAHEVEPYLVHRLAVAGWQGRPGFEPEAFASLYRHSGGVPRKLNQLASRLFLYAVVEQLETIGGGDVEAVAADMAADRPASASKRVLPLRRVSDREPAAGDPSLERRIAAIEARLDEQEAAVRRVLTVLLDWVENESQPRRSNAA